MKVVVAWIVGLLVVIGAGVGVDAAVGSKVATPFINARSWYVNGGGGYVSPPQSVTQPTGTISGTLSINDGNPGIPGPENLVRFYRSPSARLRQILDSCGQKGCPTLPTPTETTRLDRHGHFHVTLPAGSYVIFANACPLTDAVTILPGSDTATQFECLSITETAGYQ